VDNAAISWLAGSNSWEDLVPVVRVLRTCSVSRQVHYFRIVEP
jgi:hypothetical protein